MAPRERHAVRALVVTPEREILLMRIVFPEPARAVWITPGGGVKRGEEAEAALVRELLEETGLSHPAIGPELWTRRHRTRVSGEEIVQNERYFWVPSPRFEPNADGMPQEAERDWFAGFRWWRLEEIERSPERFAPRGLAALLRDLFERGLPERPIDVGT